MKDRSRQRRIEEIFQEALDRPAPARAAFLAEACGGDEALRSEVESLLAHFDAANVGFLEPPVAASPLASPDRIGPYRVLRLLGEGGMGRVWLAEQEHPVRRSVALKVLRWVSADSDLSRRFVEEQRLHARMRHPNVAPIYDVGMAEDGTPYLAMEYVDGTPVTEHCDRRNASIRDRLEIFLDVCAGVQHAHQQGIIHRDLKPSNVLVADTDGRPTPRVIDFGIAKEIDAEGVGLTRTGGLLGTPEYMSPEQIRGEGVDTRSDVYALGLLLYKLLSGRLPFADRPGEKSSVEYLQTVSTRDVPRPSERVPGTGPDVREIARRRSSDPGSLRRRLRGDVDWILLTALARDPSARYAAVGELADDVRRHLRREPIVARPPSVLYVARRFAQRHPAATAAVVSVGFALVALTGLSWRHAQRLGEERELARDAEREARQQAAIADATNRFLNEDLLQAVQPEVMGPDVKLRDVLDRASELIDERFPDDPLTRASIHRTVAQVYARLGEADEARVHADRAVEILRGVHGEEHAETAAAMNDLAGVMALQGDLSGGRELLAHALELLKRTAGPDAKKTLTCQRELAQLAGWLGESDVADSLYDDVIPRARRVLDPDDPEMIVMINNRGLNHSRAGQYDEAQQYLEEAWEAYRNLQGENSADALTTAMNLATLAGRRGDYEGAVARLEDLLPILCEVYGDDHSRTLSALSNLAENRRRAGDVNGSIEIFEDVSARFAATLGPDDRATLITTNNLGRAYLQAERFGDARRTFERVVEGRTRTFGEEHADTRASQRSLASALLREGEALRAAGREEEGARLIRRAHELEEKGADPSDSGD
jgi:non-specific serine/threonine protein kinase/serine/threonine-protein kinase